MEHLTRSDMGMDISERMALPVNHPIVEMVRQTVLLNRISHLSSVTEISNLAYGFVTPKISIDEIAKGNISMQEILTSAGLSINTSTHNLLRSIFDNGSLDLLKLLPSQLSILEHLQKAEESSRKNSRPLLSELYSEAIRKIGLDPDYDHDTTPSRWGVLAGFQFNIPESGSIGNLSEKIDRSRVHFIMKIATRVPHLIYKAHYNGVLSTGKGSVSQNLEIISYSPIVIDGWTEWFLKTCENSLIGNQLISS